MKRLQQVRESQGERILSVLVIGVSSAVEARRLCRRRSGRAGLIDGKATYGCNAS
jgi:hypothetical protein